MLKDELFCEVGSILEPSEAQEFGASLDDTAVKSGPLVVGPFRSWILKKLLALGCQQKAEIKEAAIRAITTYVRNPFLQTLLMEVLSTAIDAVCPVSATSNAELSA